MTLKIHSLKNLHKKEQALQYDATELATKTIRCEAYADCRGTESLCSARKN